MARFVIPAWQKWGRRLAIVPALGLIAALVLALPSQAIPSGAGGFESGDGNLTPATQTDWNSFASAVGINQSVTGFDDITRKIDRTGNPDDIYGGGVKQDVNCPATKEGSLGGGNSKFDMSSIYLTHAKVGTDDYLYLAWERVPGSATASAHIAYEFNQSSTACTTANSDSLVERTAGDRLIEYDFEGGTASSTSPALKLATWITSGGHCQVSNDVAPCWGDATNANGYQNLNTAGVSDAAVNSVTVGNVDDTYTGQTLVPVQFGEAGIDLTLAGIDPCSLNGVVTGVSRSSGDAGTAQMKDKVGPQPFTLPGCTQETTITSAISLDDHATINGFDATFTGDHTGSLTFDLLKPGAACNTT